MVSFKTDGNHSPISILQISARIARHPTLMRLTAMLSLLTFFITVVLAVTLYKLTRAQNPILAQTALLCRAAEGMMNAFSALSTLGLLSVASASIVADTPGSGETHSLGSLLLQQDGSSFLISAICFAVGSTIYSYLFLCARRIPVPLAWLGVYASMLLVVILPLQLMGFIKSQGTSYIWIPILVFEVTLGLWLLIKGVTITTTKGSTM